MDIGRAIKEIMEEQGIRPAQMCKDLNLDAGYVSMLTNSKVKDMKLNRALAIAKYLDVSIDYLAEKAQSYPNPQPKVKYAVVKLDGDSNA